MFFTADEATKRNEIKKKRRYNIETIERNHEKIETVLSLLGDERSREILKNDIASRKKMRNMQPSKFVESYLKQYFDGDIVKFFENEVFVDGGAYDGSTTEIFVRNVCGVYKKVYLFEPDALMFEEVKKKMSPMHNERFEYVKAGISDKSGTTSFTQLPIGSSRIDPKGPEKISTVALDDFLDEATFIKMDIEGAETKALIGSKNIILRCKPKLAIAIYHKVEDLWEIPLLIHSLNPGYKLYIRKYEGASGCFLNETVCYAIPE